MLALIPLRRSLFAALLLAPAAGAHADQDAAPGASPDTILVIGARTPVPAQDVTAAATIIDSAEIEARGAVFAADALRAVPGFALSRSGGAGSVTQLRARGSEANHILVLIDGMEAADPFTGETDLAHLVTEGAARIEILRGEQSALWGPDAIGGVINIVTAEPGETGWRAGAETGSFGTVRLTAGGSSPLGTRVWIGGFASRYSTDGIDVSGTGGARDGYDNTTIALHGQAALRPGLRLEAGGRFVRFRSEYDSDTDFDGALDDADLVREGDQRLGRLALVGEHGAGVSWRHEAALMRSEAVNETFDAGVFDARSEGNRTRAHYQLTAQFDGFGAAHRLTALAERETDDLSVFAGPGSGQNQDRTLRTDSLAFDYGVRAGPVAATLSARRDFNNRFDDATTWRAGIAADILPGGRLRAGMGEGVKNPGVYELFGFFPDFFTGNPDLTPETSRGWDVGWDQNLADGRVSLSATYYEARLEDEIFTDFSVFPFTARNAVGTSKRSGLELEAAWRPDPSLTLRGSAAFMRSSENGAAELRRPERTASLAIDWRPEGRSWRIGLAADHVGDQRDTDFGSFTTVILPAYTLISGQAAWRLKDGMELYVRGENLADERYQDVFGYASPGRGLYLGLRLGGPRA